VERRGRCSYVWGAWRDGVSRCAHTSVQLRTRARLATGRGWRREGGRGQMEAQKGGSSRASELYQLARMFENVRESSGTRWMSVPDCAGDGFVSLVQCRGLGGRVKFRGRVRRRLPWRDRAEARRAPHRNDKEFESTRLATRRSRAFKREKLFLTQTKLRPYSG
jgi:hypothetical protein